MAFKCCQLDFYISVGIKAFVMVLGQIFISLYNVRLYRLNVRK